MKNFSGLEGRMKEKGKLYQLLILVSFITVLTPLIV